VVLSGLFALAVIVIIALGPYEFPEVLYRLALRDYEQDFGFEIGLVKDWPRTSGQGMWGIVRVRPGGRMDRAGVRTGDAVFSYHGTGFGALHWAVTEAVAGRSACLDLINVEEVHAGRFSSREVCLKGKAQD
jgi:predicted metalloprotease with PDZ domain